jgi:type I restriction enzyme S subunit
MNRNRQLLAYDSGVDQTHLKKDWILGVTVPVPPLAEQNRIVAALDKFDTLTRSIAEGLPREIELRQRQYAYYRDLLLGFPKPESVEA